MRRRHLPAIGPRNVKALDEGVMVVEAIAVVEALHEGASRR
jgi:hypothetical protein